MDNGSLFPSEDKIDEVERITNSVGALAEILGLFYKELIKQGIPPEWAIKLTETYLTVLYEF